MDNQNIYLLLGLGGALAFTQRKNLKRLFEATIVYGGELRGRWSWKLAYVAKDVISVGGMEVFEMKINGSLRRFVYKPWGQEVKVGAETFKLEPNPQAIVNPLIGAVVPKKTEREVQLSWKKLTIMRERRTMIGENAYIWDISIGRERYSFVNYSSFPSGEKIYYKGVDITPVPPAALDVSGEPEGSTFVITPLTGKSFEYVPDKGVTDLVADARRRQHHYDVSDSSEDEPETMA